MIYGKSSSVNEEAMDATLPELRAVIASHKPKDVINMNKKGVRIKKDLFRLILNNSENDLGLFTTWFREESSIESDWGPQEIESHN